MQFLEYPAATAPQEQEEEEAGAMLALEVIINLEINFKVRLSKISGYFLVKKKAEKRGGGTRL